MAKNQIHKEKVEGRAETPDYPSQTVALSRGTKQAFQEDGLNNSDRKK